MRNVFIGVGVVLVMLGIILGAAFAAAGLATWAVKADPPLAGYRSATPAQASELGRRVATALAEKRHQDFDAVLDLDALLRTLIEDQPMTRRQRSQFIEGFKLEIAKKASPSLGQSLVRSMPEGTVTLLRTRFVEGHQRALLRFKPETGVNYLELVIAVDPAGQSRVVDWYNYMTGEPAHVSMRSLAEPFLAALRGAGLTRLVTALANGGRPPARPDLSRYSEALKQVQALTLAGQHAEALVAWGRLPEEIRATRIAQVLRLQCAQSLSEGEYRAALDDMDARFPGDPSLALAQIDGYFLKRDFAGLIACVERLEEAIGGDPFLAGLRATALAELGRHREAKQLVSQALAEAPEIDEIWWQGVTVSLRAEDHDETVRLLDAIQERLELEFGDFAQVPDYARFVESSAYRDWMRGRLPLRAAAGD